MEGVRAIRAIKYKKKTLESILAHLHLWRGRTQIQYSSQKIERHNFCVNDLLTKSNHTEIQTYKIEERTFGTPCIPVPTSWIEVYQSRDGPIGKTYPSHVQDTGYKYTGITL